MRKTVSYLRELPPDSLPRERLVNFGAKALSNQELLAILLGTGSQDLRVLDLSLAVLTHFRDLSELKSASLDQFETIKGIGPVKAIQLQACIELGQRIAQMRPPKLGTLTSTKAAGQWLHDALCDMQQEHLMALFLNSKNQVIRQQIIFIGSVNASVAHPREIFKEAVKYPTARLIIAHNHPSGDPEPSQADLHFTQRMIQCGDLMGIELLDHFIIGHDDYVSLRETTKLFH